MLISYKWWTTKSKYDSERHEPSAACDMHLMTRWEFSVEPVLVSTPGIKCFCMQNQNISKNFNISHPEIEISRQRNNGPRR